MADWQPVITSTSMKKYLLIALLFGHWLTGKAQHETKMDTQKKDAQVIAQLLENYYFKGIYEGKLELLDQIYYKGTLLFGDVKGQPYFKTLEQYLDAVKN